MTPRLPPRGFSDSRQEQPRNQLHPFRRNTRCECFVICSEKFVANRINRRHQRPGSSLLLKLASLLSQLFLKKYVFVPNLLLFLASHRQDFLFASCRASARLFIYTRGRFSDSRNANSRSQRF